MKRCPLWSGCGKKKDLDDFGVDKAKADGRTSYCSDCTAKKAQAYRDRSKEELEAYCREQAQKRAEQSRQWAIAGH